MVHSQMQALLPATSLRYIWPIRCVKHICCSTAADFNFEGIDFRVTTRYYQQITTRASVNFVSRSSGSIRPPCYFVLDLRAATLVSACTRSIASADDAMSIGESTLSSLVPTRFSALANANETSPHYII